MIDDLKIIVYCTTLNYAMVSHKQWKKRKLELKNWKWVWGDYKCLQKKTWRERWPTNGRAGQSQARRLNPIHSSYNKILRIETLWIWMTLVKMPKGISRYWSTNISREIQRIRPQLTRGNIEGGKQRIKSWVSTLEWYWTEERNSRGSEDNEMCCVLSWHLRLVVVTKGEKTTDNLHGKCHNWNHNTANYSSIHRSKTLNRSFRSSYSIMSLFTQEYLVINRNS